MAVQFEIVQSSGVCEVRIEGAVGGSDGEALYRALGVVWTRTPRSLLFDLDDATLDGPCRAIVLAALLHVTAEGGSSAVITEQIEFSQCFVRLSLARVAKICKSRDEAEGALLARLRKRYDNRFFNLLVERAALDRTTLKELLEVYKASGGKVPLGELLMERVGLSARTILDTLADAARNEATAMDEVRDLARRLPQNETAPSAGAIATVPSPSQALGKAQKPHGDPLVSEFVRPRLLGQILVERNVITEAQLRMVLEEQRTAPPGEKIGDTLLRLGLVTTNQLFQALESQLSRKGPSTGTVVPEPLPTPEPLSEGDGSGSSEFFQSSLLGQLLIREGLISEQDLRTALDEQRKSEGEERLGDILVRLGAVKPSDLFTALERQGD